MAKLYFYYSAMNAGKSTTLLQAAHNYEEQGMRVLLFTPRIDDRDGVGTISSRISLQREAFAFDHEFDLYVYIRQEHERSPVACVFIDESQFLTAKQVLQVTLVCDRIGISVLCYGLRTDFRGEPFEGSKYLLAWADNLNELKAICFCGAKATMVIRLAEDGNAVTQGSQVEIGGNDRYISMCRKHFKENYYRETLVPQHQLPLDVVEEP